jgi:hypothetical protein
MTVILDHALGSGHTLRSSASLSALRIASRIADQSGTIGHLSKSLPRSLLAPDDLIDRPGGLDLAGCRISDEG